MVYKCLFYAKLRKSQLGYLQILSPLKLFCSQHCCHGEPEMARFRSANSLLPFGRELRVGKDQNPLVRIWLFLETGFSSHFRGKTGIFGCYFSAEKCKRYCMSEKEDLTDCRAFKE